MALYISLEPFTFEKNGAVVHITQVGRIVELTTDQADLLPGKVAYWGSGSTYLAPQITLMAYDNKTLFPEEGSNFHVYLDQSTGRFWQWSHADGDYTQVGIDEAINLEDIEGITPTGLALLSAADELEAREVIDASPADQVVFASDLGIVADGTTDVSNELAAAIDSLGSGAVLQLEGATYYVPTLRLFAYTGDNTIRGVRGQTVLLGNGSQTTLAYSNDAMISMQAGSSIRLKDLVFADTGTPIGFKDLLNLGDIEIDSCEFDGCNGVAIAMYDPAALVTRTTAGHQMSFRHFRMTNSKVYDCDLGVFLGTAGGWESFVVDHCVFDGVGQAGVYIGWDYDPTRDRTIFQPLQSPVLVHDNVFKDIHVPTYTIANAGANAIFALGQSVSIHGNYIENVTNTSVWDDCEGIYTKARYADIHDNILINAGGTEAAIMIKGTAYEASTTLAVSMNGLNLPQSTINVASTEGFGPGLTSAATGLLIETTTGYTYVTYTGKTATSFTGVSGGVGTVATGGDVRGDMAYFGSSLGSMTGISFPSKVHDNTVIFTRSDVVQRGVVSFVPHIEISRNLIVGATGTAIMTYYGGVVDGNIVREPHGTQAIATVGTIPGASHVIRNNKIVNHDGSYTPAASSLQSIWINAADGVTLSDILVEGNYVRTELTAAGVRTAAAAKTRAIQIQAGTTGLLTDVTVRGNRGRNIDRGLHVVALGPVTGLTDFFNDWKNEEGAAPINTTSPATNVVTDADVAHISNTETFTGVKTFTGGINVRDSTFTIQDEADTTKQARFQLSGIGTGATRIYTLSNYDGTLATLAGTETFSNKTLTTPRMSTQLDTNGNAMINFAPVASSVNYFQFLNAITGQAPILRPGGETDVNLNLRGRGTGWVTVGAANARIATLDIVTLTTTITLAAEPNHEYIRLLNTGATVTLPTAVGNTSKYVLKNITGSTITVAASLSQTFDGVAGPLSIDAGASYTVVSDQTGWRII